MRTYSRLGIAAFLLFVVFLVITAVVSILPAQEARARSSKVWVRPGTTLTEIAYQYRTTPETLRWLNNMDGDDPAWGGMLIKVPPEDGMIAIRAHEGDTPSSLAAAYGVPLAALVELNKIGPAQRLKPGQVLYVRSKQGLLASDELPTHVVAAGDTIESIAAKHRSSAKLIRRYNDLEAGEKPAIGQQLVVPPLSPQERLGDTPEDKSGFPQIGVKDLPSLTEKWIDVDLSEQKVTAYQGARPVKTFLISSGKDRTPTIKGVFRIEAKVPSTRMIGGSHEDGDYYNLANVQWVSYFYGGYSFHGTYWHHNFGHPMSHGCINMTNDDAEWLYKWSSPTNSGRGRYSTPSDVKGTLVVVHD